MKRALMFALIARDDEDVPHHIALALHDAGLVITPAPKAERPGRKGGTERAGARRFDLGAR